MKLGVFVSLRDNLDEKFAFLRDNGFTACQISNWDDWRETDERAAEVNAAKEKYGIEIVAYWRGWCRPAIWNFTEGYTTLGLLPVTYRHDRMKSLCRGSDFAKGIGVENVITHVGFIPENPWSAEYHDLVSAVRQVANHCKKNGQYFCFETGQETPVTLLRMIQDVGTGNLGINLDTANLILYGKGNPVDALDVFGKYVRSTHMKDGLFPTDGYDLGEEMPLGQGKANFPEIIRKLKALNYTGAYCIEREIEGDEQIKDILEGKAYLEGIYNSL